MNFIQRKFVKLLNFLFLCVFFGHILQIGYNLKNPEIPSVKVYKKQLKDIEFPITFKLCLLEKSTSSDRYKSLGYNDSQGFYRGQNRFDQSVVGWNGHTSNKTTLASIQGKLIAMRKPTNDQCF